jgi:hypothetical protein
MVIEEAFKLADHIFGGLLLEGGEAWQRRR